ncbi:MAG: trigger factor [Tyzzerella sp.]|nr:trigger factor [Tyzzerella sp.]
MKKRILALIMAVSMMAVLTGCGNGEVSNDNITITKYKGIEVEEVAPEEVTDEAIESEILYTLQQTVAAEHGIKDRAAELGDVVIIDYEGKRDGVAFEGGTDTGYRLELGSNSFIDGFETGIVGHMPGETFDLNLTFPEEYPNNPDLAGQAVVFTVTFHAIAPTELTDALATVICGTETTVEEYKQQVKEYLQESYEANAESKFSNAVITALLENCTVKNYDEDKLEEVKAQIESQYSYVTAYGMEVDAFLEMYGTSVEKMAKEQLCWEYAVELIAEKEDLTISLEEYENKLAEIIEGSEYTVESYEEAYEEMYGEGSLKIAMLQEKVSEWLLENCKRVEASEKSEE